MTPLEKAEHCLTLLEGQLYTENEMPYFVVGMAAACKIQETLQELHKELSSSS